MNLKHSALCFLEKEFPLFLQIILASKEIGCLEVIASLVFLHANNQAEYIMKCECYDKENVNEHKILSRCYGIVLLSAKTFYVLQ